VRTARSRPVSPLGSPRPSSPRGDPGDRHVVRSRVNAFLDHAHRRSGRVPRVPPAGGRNHPAPHVVAPNGCPYGSDISRSEDPARARRPRAARRVSDRVRRPARATWRSTPAMPMARDLDAAMFRAGPRRDRSPRSEGVCPYSGRQVSGNRHRYVRHHDERAAYCRRDREL